MTIVIDIANNRDLNFVSIMNFLVSNKVVSLEKAIELHGNFKSGEKILIEVSSGLVDKLKSELEAEGCKYAFSC